jgi:hypothetical protein
MQREPITEFVSQAQKSIGFAFLYFDFLKCSILLPLTTCMQCMLMIRDNKLPPYNKPKSSIHTVIVIVKPSNQANH